MNSCLYQGILRHRRYHPKHHFFTYPIFMALLDLDELPLLAKAGIAHNRRGITAFFDRDYPLGEPLKQAVQNKLRELTGDTIDGKVFLLSQLRYFGFHFNPVNFYYCHDSAGDFRYLLAEVRNTPWNERHYYVVDAHHPQPMAKAFHVSPFNPMDMTYHWRFNLPGKTLQVHIENHQQNKVFDATLVLRRQALTRANLINLLVKLPFMTMKTVLTIYWQALRLWLKRVPVYSHPGNRKP